MVNKNAAMLVKWWWRFSDENNSLWKTVVCSCNNLLMDMPIGEQLHPKGVSPCWGICNVWKLNKEVKHVCSNGNGIEVSNGEETLMWEDLWIGNSSLKCEFPRLYSLSLQKHIKFKDCGIWDGLSWCWHLLWRRELFDWEEDLLTQLQNLLGQTHLQRDHIDKNIWYYHNSGGFSSKSVYDYVLKLQAASVAFFKYTAKVWCKLAPPKVELLVWFLVLGNLNTKDRLVRLNTLPSPDAVSVLCDDHVESIGHLFFSCNYSWKSWCSCLNWWKVEWVMPVEPWCAFESWIEVNFRKTYREKWSMCFFSVIWSIWEAINRIILQKEAFNIDNYLALMWHRWQTWTNEWC